MNIAIIFAGGSGIRMGGVPKQFIEIDGRPVLTHTLKIFEEHPKINGIYIVCNPDFREKTAGIVQRFGISKVRQFRHAFISRRKIARLYSEYRKIQTKFDFETSRNCHSLNVDFNRSYFMPKSYFSKTIEVDFEDMKCPVPAEYDKILTQRYGDYMTPPPPDQRGGHSVDQTMCWREI